MRAYLPAFEMRECTSLGDVLKLLSDYPGVWKPFAGGTDLMVLFEAGKLKHQKFVNIWNLNELRGIKEEKEHLVFGALTTYSALQANATVRSEFPMLIKAAAETGAIAIQNRGTLGGNIVNASPAADSPPALLVYSAEIELCSTGGVRWVPYSDFHTGYKTTVMRDDELLTRIRVPRPARDAAHYFRKVGTRKAQAISKVCFAGLAVRSGDKFSEVRIALGSVAPTVLRCNAVEELLRGKGLDANLKAAARAALEKDLSPIDDIRSTRAYRLKVAGNLLEEFLDHVGLA